MTGTGSPSNRRDDCRPRSFSIGRAGGTASLGCSLSPLPSFSSILLANIDGAVRTTFVRSAVWRESPQTIDNSQR